VAVARESGIGQCRLHDSMYQSQNWFQTECRAAIRVQDRRCRPVPSFSARSGSAPARSKRVRRTATAASTCPPLRTRRWAPERIQRFDQDGIQVARPSFDKKPVKSLWGEWHVARRRASLCLQGATNRRLGFRRSELWSVLAIGPGYPLHPPRGRGGCRSPGRRPPSPPWFVMRMASVPYRGPPAAFFFLPAPPRARSRFPLALRHLLGLRRRRSTSRAVDVDLPDRAEPSWNLRPIHDSSAPPRKRLMSNPVTGIDPWQW
jgi:hypothetical protein